MTKLYWRKYSGTDAARYIKESTHDVSVTDILNEWKWKSFESRMEQFSLVIIYLK